MFVSRLVVKGYRGIGTADMRFGPGLNVLVGRNGSGKTTLMQALRLLLDNNLGYQTRILDESDLPGDAGYGQLANVVIAAQFSGHDKSLSDKKGRLLFGDSDNPTWLMYRFRPSAGVRTKIGEGKADAVGLRRADYEFSRVRGVTENPLSLEWNDEVVSQDELSDRDLATISIAFIHALRDVVSDMSRERTSPLAYLISKLKIDPADEQRVEAEYMSAQKVLEAVPEFKTLASELRNRYATIAEEVQIDLRLGLAKPTFRGIVRELDLLFSDRYVSDMELQKNGLGLNNLLSIAMLLERFSRRKNNGEGSSLLLIEEPEAHLHPQAQLGVVSALKNQDFQTIVSTHSPQVAMASALRSVISLDRDDDVKGINIEDAENFSKKELDDLDRFLVADRGSLLFGSAAILVEGPSEQILIPLWASLMGHDLNRLGIHVCAINGTHFTAYEKVLGKRGINRPFVTIRDLDEQNGPDRKVVKRYDDGANVSATAGDFATATTFEYALTSLASIPALLGTISTFNMPTYVKILETLLAAGDDDSVAQAQTWVLKAVLRIGKARFAQALAERLLAGEVPCPPYVREAIESVVARRAAAAAATSRAGAGIVPGTGGIARAL